MRSLIPRPRTLALLAWTLPLFACAAPPVTTPPATTQTAPQPAAEPTLQPVARPKMQWVASPHFRKARRTRQTVDAIAIHTTEGKFRVGNSHARNQRQNYYGTIQYFRNNKRSVSAHFVLSPTGDITQMVKEADVAHTTTYYNTRSFGIECAGWSSRDATWTPELMDSLVELCAYLCIEWDIPAVHPTGTAYKSPHRVETRNPQRPRFDAPGIVGHFQVQPWNKTDPGKHFPWEVFMRRLQARIAASNGTATRSDLDDNPAPVEPK